MTKKEQLLETLHFFRKKYGKNDKHVLKILLLLADKNEYEYRKRNFEIKFGYKE